jgi:hypothetical protein
MTEKPQKAKGGRPTKRTAQVEEALFTALKTGAPYRIACMACGITDDTFANWRKADPEFAQQVEKVSGQTALRLLKKIEAQGKENFSACAWLLERRFPESFSRPEVQLNLIQQNNVVENHLTIRITAEEYAAIEAQNEPVRRRVEEMFQKYRPGLGNGEKVHCEVEVEAVLEQQAPEAPGLAVIRHREGDEKSQAFWKMLVSSDPQSFVSKETAIFAIRVLLVQFGWL